MHSLITSYPERDRTIEVVAPDGSEVRRVDYATANDLVNHLGWKRQNVANLSKSQS
jgi:hypothetical protein